MWELKLDLTAMSMNKTWRSWRWNLSSKPYFVIEQSGDNSTDLKAAADILRLNRFHDTLIAKPISQSDNWRTEQSLWRFCYTCWCNLNLYFWGELFLTLWPCHAHWTLTMTDLSAAFLLWSLAQEWATGSELLCRPDRSGFLFCLSDDEASFWAQKYHLTDFTCIRAQKVLRDNILFAVN